MKKKLLIALMAITAAICCIFAFTACDGNIGGNGSQSSSGGNTEHGNGTQQGDNGGNTEHTHSYTDSVVAPTCTEKGFTLHTCECGDSYKDNYTNALGHTEVTDKAVEATCTQTGKTEGKQYFEEKEIINREVLKARKKNITLVLQAIVKWDSIESRYIMWWLFHWCYPCFYSIILI